MKDSHHIIQMPRVKLGSQGLEVSRLGFGCAGLSGYYNQPLSHEAGCSVIKEAFRNGITFFDTSDLYGENHDNEILLSKALKELPRAKVQLATKFGIKTSEGGKFAVKGDPEYVRQCCEASLKRLEIDFIDLYYQHRVDATVPIEDTPGFPRFAGENLEKNKQLYDRLAYLAAKKNCTPPQLALAWLLHHEDDIVPIPGTTKVKNLHNNLGALSVKLTAEDLKEISDAVPIDEVAGEKDPDVIQQYSREFTNTPEKS